MDAASTGGDGDVRGEGTRSLGGRAGERTEDQPACTPDAPRQYEASC